MLAGCAGAQPAFLPPALRLALCTAVSAARVTLKRDQVLLRPCPREGEDVPPSVSQFISKDITMSSHPPCVGGPPGAASHPRFLLVTCQGTGPHDSLTAHWTGTGPFPLAHGHGEEGGGLRGTRTSLKRKKPVQVNGCSVGN